MPYFTAQKVIVPELLGEDEETISQANGLFQGAIRLTLLLGPPLGGVLIGVIGAANVLVIDGVTYLVSFALVGAFVPTARAAAGVGGGHGRDPRRGALPRSVSSLLRVWIPFFVAGDAAWQAFFAAVPVLVIERFDAARRSPGLLFAGFGAGALIGNFLSFRFFVQRVRRPPAGRADRAAAGGSRSGS